MTTLMRAVGIGAAAVLLGGSVFVRAQSQPAGARARVRRLRKATSSRSSRTTATSATGRRRPAAGCACTSPESIRKGGDVRAGHHAGQERRQPDDSSGARPRRRRSDAARRRSAARGRDRAAACVDRSGRAVPAAGSIQAVDRNRAGAGNGRGALGVCEAVAAGAADGEEPRRGCAMPIDRFVLARLEQEELAPSPEAVEGDAAPPRHARPDRAAADAATSRRVPRRLARPTPTSASSIGCSPRRTTASAGRGPGSTSRATPTRNGYEKDNRRAIWKYRDWVIDALNRDMPFDQFTIEQIAGDMLPNATTEQKIASGFHRNTMTNEEGGIDPEESRYEVLVDRVNTTATVWLGTTLGCAQCHNHKYDPFTQKDYYRLLAFFANADYESTHVRRRHALLRAELDLATPEQEKARKSAAGRDRSARAGAEDRRRRRCARRRASGSSRCASRSRLDAAGATRRVARDERRGADGAAGRLGARVGAESGAHVVHRDRSDTRSRASPACGSKRCPIRRCRRGGPGRDAYGTSASPDSRSSIAPVDRRTPQPAATPSASRPSRWTTRRSPFEPADLLGRSGDSRPQARLVGDQRDARHRTRAAPCGARRRRAVRLRRRHAASRVRIDHLDGTIGQGIGRFRVCR